MPDRKESEELLLRFRVASHWRCWSWKRRAMDRPHKRQDCILQRMDPWAYAFTELERSQRGAGTHGPPPLDEALVPHSSRGPKLCYLDKAAYIGRLRSCDAVEGS
ncbi:uncharacterized protein LOC112340796 [Selaginella moellendorffii]|uniref:uncharacterized protein LOC112340796 n=1 Tax=Selaginella moellendorffii TaxID=88036 RepID=UPI000D1CFE13|nr:uncharacterized protein LOC112340796 [Selaginella moellendorffii]|eukprot:XP_024515583.1 uncharacterized protein LOC112340796 [Selaginella moellendorffii]